MSNLPEVGVQLRAKDLETFLADLGRAQSKADAVRTALATPIVIKFSVQAPTDAQFSAVVDKAVAAASKASKEAKIRITPALDASGMQAGAASGGSVASVDKAAAAATRAQTKLVDQSKREENRRQREADAAANRQLRHMETLQRQEEAWRAREERAAEARARRRAESDAEYQARQAERLEREATRRAETSAASARRAEERERRNAEASARSQQRATQDAAWKNLSPRERLLAEYERDFQDLNRQFSEASDDQARASIVAAAESRRQRYRVQLTNFEESQAAELNKAIGGFDDEVRRLGISRGETFYVFRDLENQRAEFDARIKKTVRDYGDAVTDEHISRLATAQAEYNRLFTENERAATEQAKERLNRQYYETSFMGELARAETRTYGARILAGEMQRYGMMGMVAGAAGVYGSQRLTERYLTDFRQPLSRVSRALDLSSYMEDELDSTLLDRAGRRSFLMAEEQSDAMRVWAEAVNVVVDSYDDLLSVSEGVEVGLVPQTEMITNLVKLNEGSASLEQTVADTAAIMTQFSLTSSDSAEQTENLLRVVSLLDTAASSGLANVNDIGSALSYFAGSAANLGVSLTEAVVMVETLAQAGQGGSKGGRGMEQILKSLSSPTPRAEGAYEKLFGPNWQSFIFDPSSGDFRGMISYIESLADATKDLSQQDLGDTLINITGDANARRMLTYLLEREHQALAVGTRYMRNMVELRNNGNAAIRDQIVLLEQALGIELGSLSAIESYDQRLAHLAQQEETRYTNAMIRMDAAMLKLGKSLVTTVVPAVDLLADALGTVADIVEKYPGIATLFFGGAAITAVGGAALAGAGTVGRGAIDIFAFVSALRATGNQGLPFMTRLMGLGASQTGALVAAGRAKGALSDLEIMKIVQMSSSRAGSAQIIAAAGSGAEALTATLNGTSLAATSASLSLKSAATTVLKFGGAIGAVTGTVLLLDKIARETVGKDELTRRAAPEVSEGASFSSASWLLGPLRTERGADFSRWFTDLLTISYLSPDSHAQTMTGPQADVTEQRLRDVVRMAEQGDLPRALTLVGEAISVFTRGGVDLFSVEGARRQLNRFLLARGQEPIDYDASARRAAVPITVSSAQQSVTEYAMAQLSAVDVFAMTPEALEKMGEDLISQAVEYGTQMRIAGASAEDVETYMLRSVDAINQFMAAAEDPSLTMFDMAANAAKVAEELQKAADVSARLSIEGGFADNTAWMGLSAPVTSQDIARMAEERLSQIGDMEKALFEQGVLSPGEIASLVSGAREGIIRQSQAAQALSSSSFAPSERFVTEMFDKAMAGFEGTVERYSRAGVLADLLAPPDFTTAWESALNIVDELRSSLKEVGVDQATINSLVQSYTGYLDSSNAEASQLPEKASDVAVKLQGMNEKMGVFLALLAAAKGDASLLAAVLNNMPTLPGADPEGLSKRNEINSILEAGRRDSLSQEERLKEDYEAERASLIELGATQDDLAQSSRNYQARLNALSSSTSKATMSFEDMVGRLRSMISERITPDSGLTVTDEDMGLTKLGKYQDGAWEPLRRLASAATDPNTKWKDMLPPGIGVASPEAQAYFEQVKAGVERFDPAFSAFFPDRRKVVEDVIKDLEGQQRQEQYITSIVEEMANMGFDEASLRKYFADPQEELDQSVSLLRYGVDDQKRATDDSTRAVRDQIGYLEGNTTAVGTLTGSIDALYTWISQKDSGGKPPEEISPKEGEGKKGVIIYNPNVVIPPNAPPTPFARGGIVTRPTYALIGEAGPELIVPLSRSGIGQGFVAPSQQVNLHTMAPQIGAINVNTSVTSPSPAFVAHTLAKSNRREAVAIGRQILRAAAREGA